MCIKPGSHYINYQMDNNYHIYYGYRPNVNCETYKCKVEICNFDNLFFNQNDCGTPVCTNFAVLVCSRPKDQNCVY